LSAFFTDQLNNRYRTRSCVSLVQFQLNAAMQLCENARPVQRQVQPAPMNDRVNAQLSEFLVVRVNAKEIQNFLLKRMG
jgi:hypothetical protein